MEPYEVIILEEESEEEYDVYVNNSDDEKDEEYEVSKSDLVHAKSDNVVYERKRRVRNQNRR